MNYDEIKEKLISSGYGFCEANGGILAIIKSNIMNTSIVTFIDFSNFYKNKIFKVKYKCARTNNFFSENTYTNLDIECFINDHKNFIDSLKILDKISSYTFEDLMNSYAN